MIPRIRRGSPARPAAWVAAAFWVGASSGCTPGPLPPPAPDVVLITIDTLRADRLGCYGYFRDTTPVLDALAEESLRFERCLAPMAVTYPSHLALLTSTYPAAHGAVANCAAGGRPFVPTSSLRSWPMVLQEAGYRTAAVVSATPLKRHCGLNAGFDAWYQPRTYANRGDQTTAAVLDWLGRRSAADPGAPGDDAGGDAAAPFFLWAHYYDPHDSYEPPEPFASRWRTDAEQERHLVERGFGPEKAGYQPDLSMPAYNNLYDGEVSYVDREVGRVLAALRRDPERWARTIVIVVGDHGEGLGQHGEVYHGMVWGEQLRTPLLMRVPGVESRVVERLVSLADVVPMLFGLSELPGEEAYLGQATGVDRLRDEAAGAGEVYLLAQESSAPWRMKEGRTRPHFALTGEAWKLVHDPHGDDRLFRLDEDPWEQRDVAAEHPDVARRLRERTLAEVAAVDSAAAERAGPVPPIDSQTMEEMRALGYVK